MIWKKKKVLVTVKAYPEKSKTHGDTVCTIGLTEEGEWIRLYPIPYETYIFKEINRYDWIEVECAKASEKLSRKESFKIRTNSLKVIDKSLSSSGTNGKPDWAERNKIVLPHVSPSIESLSDQFKIDGTSIGLIKPKDIIKFYKDEDLEIYNDSKKALQQTFFGASIPNVEKIPHIFGYEFTCNGCQEEKRHRIQCEDWELLESYRKWGLIYGNVDTLWDKLKEQYHDKMLKRDIYFYMGMFSRYTTWLIVGLYYPPRVVGPSARTTATSLNDFIK
jgi:hypothetical protein